MKATELLKKQHRKVEATLKKLEGNRGDKAASLEDLANDLVGHMVIEEEIFYPAVREADPDLVLEAFEEHGVATFALTRLLATDPDHESFKARVTTLKDLIMHHVEEEEGDLFAKVEDAMGDALAELGKNMKARFDEVQREGFETFLSKRRAPARTRSRGRTGRARVARANGA